MVKKLVAGAGVVASFAVALAPLATFATVSNDVSDQHADELVLTVLPSCTFGSASKTTDSYPGGITHDDSTGGYAADDTNGTYNATSWNTAVSSADSFDSGNHHTDDVASTGFGTLAGESGTITSTTNASEHTVHRSMLAGTSTDTFASTTMYIVCNNGEGYTVQATAAALSNGTTAEDIPVSSSYSATSSGYTLKTITPSTGVTAENVAANAYDNTTIASKSGVSAEAGDTVQVVYGLGVASSQKAATYAGKVTYKLYKGVNNS